MPAQYRIVEFPSHTSDAAISGKLAFETACAASDLVFELVAGKIDHARRGLVFMCLYAFTPEQDLTPISGHFRSTPLPANWSRIAMVDVH